MASTANSSSKQYGFECFGRQWLKLAVPLKKINILFASEANIGYTLVVIECSLKTYDESSAAVIEAPFT